MSESKYKPKGMIIKITCQSCGEPFNRSSRRPETNNCRRKNCVWKNYGVIKEAYLELKTARREKRRAWEERKVEEIIRNEAKF